MQSPVDDHSDQNSYTLKALPDRLAVCQLPAHTNIPEWALLGELVSVTRTPAELSIVCPQRFVPSDVKAERDWRALEVLGPLDFSLVGVLASLTGTLAEVGISIFALSTYNTDYLLVKEREFENATVALAAAGHILEVL